MAENLLTQDEIDALLGGITQPVSDERTEGGGGTGGTGGPPSNIVKILNPDETEIFRKFIDDVFCGGSEAFTSIISAVTKVVLIEVNEDKKENISRHYKDQVMHQYYIDFDSAIKGRGGIFIKLSDTLAFGDILLGGDGTAGDINNKTHYDKAIEEFFKRFSEIYLKNKLTSLAGEIPFEANISFAGSSDFKDGYDPGFGNDLIYARLNFEISFNADKNKLNFEMFICMPVSVSQDIISLIGTVMLQSKQPEAEISVSPSASQSLLITNQDEIDAILNQVTSQAAAPQPQQQQTAQQQQVLQPQQPQIAAQQQQVLQPQQPQIAAQQQQVLQPPPPPQQQQQMAGYPPQQMAGYPPQQPQMGGYPPQQMAGYPPQQMGGYPPQQPQMGGYPPQQMAGYPPQQPQMGGYPPQQMAGYPPQQPQMGGYPPQQNVQSAKFSTLNYGTPAGATSNIELLLDVPLTLTVELGRTRMLIKEILELTAGSIIELDKIAGESIDVLINNKLVAKGEVVVIDENFGIRITNIISPHERLQSLKP